MNTINPGGIRYDTELGPLFLDTLLDSPTVDLIVNQMRRQLLEPNDIVGASIVDGVVSFELREPLSND